jgi:hypothetical protein
MALDDGAHKLLGFCVNRTLTASNRWNSFWGSLTVNDATGMPSTASAYLNSVATG